MVQTINLSNKVLSFLQERGKATRSEISAECFKGRVQKMQIDACLDNLLEATPPKICVQIIQRSVDAPGSQTRVYRLG
jgi:putative DNA primase/helicase